MSDFSLDKYKRLFDLSGRVMIPLEEKSTP